VTITSSGARKRVLKRPTLRSQTKRIRSSGPIIPGPTLMSRRAGVNTRTWTIIWMMSAGGRPGVERPGLLALIVGEEGAESCGDAGAGEFEFVRGRDRSGREES
jgi:hypothetical protein